MARLRGSCRYRRSTCGQASQQLREATRGSLQSLVTHLTLRTHHVNHAARKLSLCWFFEQLRVVLHSRLRFLIGQRCSPARRLLRPRPGSQCGGSQGRAALRRGCAARWRSLPASAAGKGTERRWAPHPPGLHCAGAAARRPLRRPCLCLVWEGTGRGQAGAPLAAGPAAG